MRQSGDESVARQAGLTFPFFSSAPKSNYPKSFSLPHSTKPRKATIDDLTKPFKHFTSSNVHSTTDRTILSGRAKYGNRERCGRSIERSPCGMVPMFYGIRRNRKFPQHCLDGLPFIFNHYPILPLGSKSLLLKNKSHQ